MDVKLRTLPTQVAGVLVGRIVGRRVRRRAGALGAADRVEFSVSRAVAREALKILQSLDMVDISQGRRVTLRPPAEWDYLSPLLIEWLPAAQIRRLLPELHEARLMFEPAIAAQAARSLTEADLVHLRGTVEAMRRGA